MSGYLGHLPATVRLDARLTPMAKVVYAELTSRATAEGKTRYPVAQLAAALQVTERTINRALISLHECGFLGRDGNNIVLKEMGTVIRTIKPTKKNLEKQAHEELVKKMQGILDKWNELYDTTLGSSIESQEMYYDLLAQRLSEFSEEQILHAVKVRYISTKDEPWWNKPENFSKKVDLSLLIKTNERLAKYVEMPVPDDNSVNAFEVKKGNKKLLE